MDFSEIADDDISNLGFEFDNDKSSPPKKLGERAGRMPSRHPAPRGQFGGPPRFVGPRPPFPPMRPPFLPREHSFPRDGPPFDHRGPPFDPGYGPRFGPRGPHGPPREHTREPPFSPRGPHFGPRGSRDHPMGRGERPMGRGERPLQPSQPKNPLTLPRGPRMPQPRPLRNQPKSNEPKPQNQTRPLKQGKQQIKVEKEPQKNQRNGKGAGKTSGNIVKKEKVEPTQSTVNDSDNNEAEEKLLRGSDDEGNKSQGVDLEDAVSIHGDEEFDIEKDQEEKINEIKVQPKTEESNEKVEPEHKDVKGRRRDDKFEDRRDFNRGRGRGFNRGRGGREFNRGRTPPRFRGPERDMHPPLHDSGHRPFPAGPLPPNFPRPHLGKNIHVNPHFMAPRPGFEGPRGPHAMPGRHPFPGQIVAPRFDVPVPGRAMAPRPAVLHHASPELPARLASPGPTGLGTHRMVNPMAAETLLARPVHHPQLAAGMSPAMQVAQRSPHMDRMYLGPRMIMSNDRADFGVLYNNPAYIARQQYPAAAAAAAAAMQQAMYENWQQQMRRDQTFDRESTERPTKRAREKPNRKYSDNSDFSSRSRSGSFSDSRSGSYSRSVSRSWSRSKSRSLSPSPARSWSKSISRSRSRTPVSRSRSSPKREVRMPKVGSPSRREERSAKRTREIRRETRNERHVSRIARVDELRSRSPRSRRGPRVVHEKTRGKERGHQESDRTRGDRGKVEPSKQRQREKERDRKPERSRNNEAEGREKAGSRRTKIKSRGDSSRHSHRRSPDRKSSDSKANRVVATKSSTSGKPTNRIVIGSLPESITPFKLKELLATIGPIEQLKMSTTKHKALVTFEKHEHALACRRKFHRQLMEKAREQKRDMHIACADFTKAFDTVSRDLFDIILGKLGCPPKFFRIIKKLHARLVIDGELTDPFEHNSGIKQSCKLAPTLYGIYAAVLLRLSYKKIKHKHSIKVRFRYDVLFDLRRLMNNTKIFTEYISEEQMILQSLVTLQLVYKLSSHTYNDFAKKLKMGLRINITSNVLRSLVARAVLRNRRGVGSSPGGGPVLHN